MLVKQSFEHQILFEFKRFADGMLSKMDEQNKLLSHLVLSQKSNYTSFPTFQSVKIKYDKCETKSNWDQCEVMEHNRSDRVVSWSLLIWEVWGESAPAFWKESKKFTRYS